MLDLKVYNKLSPKKGRVLITEPFLEDDYFERSVVLICEHNEDGSFGFVLNKYSEIELQDISDFPSFDTQISIGGPVDPQHLYYIHTLGHDIPGSIEVVDGLYMGGDFEALKEKANLGLIKKNQIRFFIGYSGWTKGQLEDELVKNAWLVSDIIDLSALMNDQYETIWEDYMRHQGGKYKAFAQFPIDHKLN
ncbi:MAG: YqgE/AlgH family protein [Putridiphycobacter sp.]|nr:YqgE/AlgH family protein [Putridiphycobacter sp.]